MNLRKIREDRGLSKRKAAKLLGTTPQAIGRWERGEINPNQTSLNKLADLYGVSLDELVGRNTQPRAV